MATQLVQAQALRQVPDALALGFDDTRALLGQALPWIGQARAQRAAAFGLALDAPGYHLLVVGEPGTGRSSLMREAMLAQAACQPVPPDLCYLHNFDAPEHPRALRLPAGEGRLLRQAMAQLVRRLPQAVVARVQAADAKAEAARIEASYKQEEAHAYAELNAFAQARQFSLLREQDHLVFTWHDAAGEPLTAARSMALSREEREAIDSAEAELRSEIGRFLERTRALEHVMNEGLAALRRQMVKPLIEDALQGIRNSFRKQIKDALKLGAFLAQVQNELLENLPLFVPGDDDETLRQEALAEVLSQLQVNLVVDNHGLQGAPVIVEDNPLFRSLFGSIEYASDGEALVTDFSRIRAGSLLRAHGGFLLLHLRDLMSDAPVWEKLRRVVRSGRLQIEEPGTMYAPLAAVSLEPEAVEVALKIVLVASPEEQALVQALDAEFMRGFGCTVVFAERLRASADTAQATAVLVAQWCERQGLPHLQADAVAVLLADSHRQAGHQHYQSARFDRLQRLVTEAGALARVRGADRVAATDVQAALAALRERHDAPEQRWLEALEDGEFAMQVHGERQGGLNGLMVVEQADHAWGMPLTISAHTRAGDAGVLNIEREVELSGPQHDKAVLILGAYLHRLFAHLAPLALEAVLVFEQSEAGVEGDSAAAAECAALLSSLAGVPLAQGLALTGALGLDGRLLPVGGVNEKIEGYYRACERLGLDGRQGVILPARNREHLMLAPEVVQAVAQGRFRVLLADTLGEAMTLLCGLPFGERHGADFTPGSLLARAQARLLAFRQACQQAPTARERPSRKGQRRGQGQHAIHGLHGDGAG